MLATVLDKALLNAARKGDLDDAMDALAEHAHPDRASDVMSRVALYHAAANGDTDMVKLLIKAKASIDVDDDDGATPLIAALSNRHFDAAELLFKAGANLNVVTGRQDQSPLHWAYNMDMRDGTTDRTLWLVERGADPKVANGNDRNIYDRAWDDEVRLPHGIRIAESITRFFNATAEQEKTVSAEALAQDIAAAVHGGLSDDVTVRTLKLKPARGSSS